MNKTNKTIDQLINNCLNLVHDHVVRNRIKYDDIFKNSFVNAIIDAIYNDSIDEVKNIFSSEDLRNKIKDFFVKKDPTPPIAASDKLETWLDSSIRTNSEDRFDCYIKLLIDEGKQEIVQSMDADTFSILDKCHNPKILNREWDRRGLVYGHVQSGKTANYIS